MTGEKGSKPCGKEREQRRLLGTLSLIVLSLTRTATPEQMGDPIGFPKPMPIRHDAQVFPRLFATNQKLNPPFLPLDAELAPIGENRSFGEEGMLCFTKREQMNTSCITLSRFSTGWFDGRKTFGRQNSSTNNNDNITTIIKIIQSMQFGLMDLGRGLSLLTHQLPPTQPKWAPYCWGTYEGETWPWTGCQSRGIRWAENSGKFTFSPDVAGPERFIQGFLQQEENFNPSDSWLLCGINGSCLDASPLVMINGGSYGVGNLSCASNHSQIGFGERASDPFNVSKRCYGVIQELASTIHYPSTPVCVYPPFMFIVSNISLRNCNNDTCFYTQCWNASRYNLALVARVPRWVPVLVDAPSTMSLFRYKRDFGITAAVVTAVALTATAATVAAVAMSHTVQTAQMR
ncbi:uncharacterized protein LOC118592184 [Onychomys torridus]|uniref:uncharacterized protein LOC118592184 n=1 Tax=Onychomys torridus TaxID=38674 RepID=UPI00167F2F56|nr:uncharacterized protein LOC118592184 [Onychomys torridus]